MEPEQANTYRQFVQDCSAFPKGSPGEPKQTASDPLEDLLPAHAALVLVPHSESPAKPWTSVRQPWPAANPALGALFRKLHLRKCRGFPQLIPDRTLPSSTCLACFLSSGDPRGLSRPRWKVKEVKNPREAGNC